MNTNSKRLRIYLAIMLVATAIATTLRTIACVNHMNYSNGFFTDKSLVGIGNAITALTVVGMLTYLLTASRISLRASFSTASTYVPTGILGVATAFLGAKLTAYIIDAIGYSIYSPTFIKTLFSRDGIPTLIAIFTAVLAFISIAHHFFNAFATESKNIARAYFSTATILFLALYSTIVSIDNTIAINESAKILRQTAFITSAAFFLYESRISLGREMWRLYTAFGLVSAALTAYTSIPAIITYYARGKIISSANSDSLASLEEYVLLLALCIFIVARLCITANLKEEKDNELVKALSAAAREREQRISESAERHKEIFASKQLSIFDLYGDDEIEVADDVTTVEEPIDEVEEKKEPTISDDAIYESIFGKMPERATEVVDNIEEDIPDDRAPEEIAEDILNALDEALKETDI